jgi:hypothetical protein
MENKKGHCAAAESALFMLPDKRAEQEPLSDARHLSAESD